ncbi:MAG: hypothetical protein ACKOGH_09400, partial [Alphaproteobacteria bacterium]
LDRVPLPAVHAGHDRPRAGRGAVTAMSQDAELARRQRAKNVAIGVTVAGFCLLFVLITIVRMGMR